MKVLFFALHWGYLRPYVSVLEELAAQGHKVHIAADLQETFGNRPLVERLAREHDNITFGWTPDRRESWLNRFKPHLRHGINYLRYLEPDYLTATALKDSGAYRTPRFIRWLAERVDRNRLERFLRWLERLIPVDRTLLRYVSEIAPDVVLITPLLGISEDQFDELRAASRFGVPTCFCVASWDNLSSMAYIRFVPDRIFVWNETQKREAIDMHRVPADRVVVTGAQSFDKWFERNPERSRAEFAAHVGLPPDRPFLLYMCSCLMPGSPSEADLVAEWFETLRQFGDRKLAEMAILVRPHPQRMKQWENFDASKFEGLTLWGRNPIDDDAQADYYDSMYYSELIVGLSSTAMLEAAALGKPVFTVLLDRFRPNQEGMPHFRYLLEVGGGLLYTAKSLSAHAEQLARTVRAPERPDPRSVAFTKAFIRPHGLEIPGTAIFVREIAACASQPTRVVERSRLSTFVGRQAVLYPIVGITQLSGLVSPWLENAFIETRRAARRAGRSARRIGSHILNLEKRSAPGAYLKVRSYPQIGDSAISRTRALLVWSIRRERGNFRFDDDRETVIPGFLVRYGWLYPLIMIGTVAASGLAMVRKRRRWIQRLVHQYRHRRGKRLSALAHEWRTLRSRSRMTAHRARKRLRSRWNGALRRIRQVLGG